MTAEKWRLIRSGPLAGALNMALDEALLEAVAAGRSAPVLRLYRWSSPALSLGYFQRGERGVDPEACRALGLDVLRRITGGRAVLHHREVTYAVIAPEGGALFSGGLRENYQVVAQVLQRTMASFGIEAALAPGRAREERKKSALERACFTTPARYELLHRGCKMSGSAQKRRGGAFLQHGSIPVDLDVSLLYRALNPGSPAHVTEGSRRLAEKVGWLNRWLPQPVSVAEVEDRLLASFSKQWQVPLIEEAPSTAERARALALQKEKYENLRWTLEGKV